MSAIGSRDYQRERAIRALTRALNQFPSLRIGQLLENAKPEHADLFYLSDEKMAENLEGYCASRALADIPKSKDS